MPQRRWYGAMLLAAALLGRPSDGRPAPAPAPVPTAPVWATVSDAPVPVAPVPAVPPRPLPIVGGEPVRPAVNANPAVCRSVPDDGWQGRAPPPAPAVFPVPLTPVIQQVGYKPPPAPVPSQLEADNAKKRPASPAPAPVTPPTPVIPAVQAAVSVEVVAPAVTQLGQPLVYEIVVRNTGTAAAGNVRVENAMPVAAKFVQSEPPAEVEKERTIWLLGNLDKGAERRISVTVQPAALGEFGTQPTVSFAAAPSPRTRVVRPALDVTQSAPETVQRGQTVPFEIRVTNTTNEPLQHVVLRAQIPPNMQFMQGNLVEAEVGTLAPNQTRTVHLNADAVQVGQAVNEVTARAAGGLTGRSEAAVVIEEPGIQVRVEGTRQATLGGEINLRIELTNNGSKPAAGVGLFLTLPDGIEPLSASTGGKVDATNRHVVSWTLGALGNGEHQSLTLKAQARLGGDWLCQAAVRADGLAETKTSTTLHIEAAPTLWVEVHAHDDAIDTGAETVYEMRVLNQAGVPCPGVRLLAQLPDGLQLLHAEGPTAAVIQQQRVQFDPLPELPGHNEAVFRLRVRGRQPGEWRVRVQVDADPLGAPVLQEAYLRVTAGGHEVWRPPVGGGLIATPR